jgi:pimeloyl-ACP methyl ester carboxylesterase
VSSEVRRNHAQEQKSDSMIIDRGLTLLRGGALVPWHDLRSALCQSDFRLCFSAAAKFRSSPLVAGRLPSPDITVKLPQLGPCTDSPEQALSLDSSKPVTVLVHGCNGSAGRFRSLAQLYAFHGQQAVCFSYDDRDSLVLSASQLIAAVGALAGKMQNREITVIGHSMGGLVARRAMEGERRIEWERDGLNVNLVTVSAPVSGIAAAKPCGNRVLHWASLGLVPLSCMAATGDNWHEITLRPILFVVLVR